MVKKGKKVVEDEVTEDEVVEDEEIDTADASETVSNFAVYKNGTLIKIFNSVTHGAEYKKIAKAMAKRFEDEGSEAEAKAYFHDELPEIEKNVVTIVNASGTMIRQYSESVHGADYKEIANAFVAKYGAKRGYRIA